jgi:lipoprotein-releasing system ATP-binding protein
MILKANKLSKSYKEPKKIEILREITLSVDEGESVAIMGPSGVGKSTLLHILGTLEEPTSGSLEILGSDALTGDCSAMRNQHIGFVFQNFNLLEEYSVLENVLMPAKVGRKPIGRGSDALTHAEALLERVGLTSHKHQIAKHLSGGEKQRVAIARAFCNNPDLILADEPSGNLDEGNSKLIHELLITSTRDFKKSLIVVTHNAALANLCDRKYLLTDGSLTSI